MNIFLENKFIELENANNYECWYLVKQPTDFGCLCYLVSFLKEFKELDTNGNLEKYISEKVNDNRITSGVKISNN